ncbi:MAG: hypothetical protein H7255_11950 [Ramlibacter sp.]|nr:hypothetical protein [Ramlibacter sp.]
MNLCLRGDRDLSLSDLLELELELELELDVWLLLELTLASTSEGGPDPSFDSASKRTFRFFGSPDDSLLRDPLGWSTLFVREDLEFSFLVSYVRLLSGSSTLNFGDS